MDNSNENSNSNTASRADLPALPTVDEVSRRLAMVFPAGTPNRNYVVRELAAKTVFMMLYVGAIEGRKTFVRPKQIVSMTNMQSLRTSGKDRLQWARNSLSRGFRAAQGRWYADNTREPIRDETLRQGLITLNAVIERNNLPTTSSKPRYTLRAGFAELFSCELNGKPLETAIEAWRKKNLSQTALARTEIVRQAGATSAEKVTVVFPNGESRLMAPGPSSAISKAVIEVFASRYLSEPAVIWLSESGNKVVARDDNLAASIGLAISPDRNLPDIILADLGEETTLLVFVEVVATDGAVTEDRRAALEAIACGAGFGVESVAFVTAFLDRENAAFRKCVSALAWRSFAWFAAEPECLVGLHDGTTCHSRLADYLDHPYQ